MTLTLTHGTMSHARQDLPFGTFYLVPISARQNRKAPPHEAAPPKRTIAKISNPQPNPKQKAGFEL